MQYFDHRDILLATGEQGNELFQHQINAMDKELDELVYRLYEPTEPEMRIIGGGER